MIEQPARLIVRDHQQRLRPPPPSVTAASTSSTEISARVRAGGVEFVRRTDRNRAEFAVIPAQAAIHPHEKTQVSTCIALINVVLIASMLLSVCKKLFAN
jgi:hypothetical protein